MADGTSQQQVQPDDGFTFSQQDLTDLLAGAFEGAASFQKAATEAAVGNFESAINTVAAEFNNKSAAFSKLAANAQAKERCYP